MQVVIAPVQVQLQIQVPAHEYHSSLRPHINHITCSAAATVSSCILATPPSDPSQPPTAIQYPSNTPISTFIAPENDTTRQRHTSLSIQGHIAERTIELATLQPMCQKRVQGVSVASSGAHSSDTGTSGKVEMAGCLRLTATITAVAYVLPHDSCSHVQSLLMKDAAASLQARYCNIF